MATLTGTADNDQLIGGGDNDMLIGLDGDDTLDGGDGVDTLVGGVGNDTYFVGETGGVADTVVENPNEGVDGINWSGASDYVMPDNVEVMLVSGASTLLSGNAGDNMIVLIRDADPGVAAQIDGGDGDDIITGGNGGDTLTGGAGQDWLRGWSGNDQLSGGDGDDILIGNIDSLPDPDDTTDIGDNTMSGGAGNDFFFSVNGADVMNGDEGSDSFYADGADTMTGGAGFDLYNYTVPYMGGTDVITDFVHGEDHIVLEQRSELVSITQDGADAVVTLELGDVTGTVRLANVDASTLDASDFLSWDDGTAQDDVLTGGASGDSMNGREGADRLAGVGGGDVLLGGDGRDKLNGGAGDDVLSGGAGRDLLKGGKGADTFAFNMGDGHDTITDFSAAQHDRIDLSGIDANSHKPGDQAFHFVGHFGGHAGEAVLAYHADAGQTVLRLDVDGDGHADFALSINGQVEAGAGFVL